jgi:hypothetical protein
MTKSSKPGAKRAPKSQLRVGKIAIRELTARKDASVKGGLNGTMKCGSKIG